MLTVSRFFRCLSDETRLRCVMLVHQEGELCVCELSAALNLSQPKISRHLALLRQCGLLIDRRDGQWVFYQVDPDLPEWVVVFLKDSLAAVQSSEQFETDRERLRSVARMPVSPRQFLTEG